MKPPVRVRRLPRNQRDNELPEPLPVPEMDFELEASASILVKKEPKSRRKLKVKLEPPCIELESRLEQKPQILHEYVYEDGDAVKIKPEPERRNKRKRKAATEVKVKPEQQLDDVVIIAPQAKRKKVVATKVVKAKKVALIKPLRTLKVAGVTFRSNNVKNAMIKNGEVFTQDRYTNQHSVTLIPEPKNIYDSYAIKVIISDYFCGYIPKSENRCIDINATYRVWGLRYVERLNAHAIVLAQMPKIEKIEE